MRTRVKEMSRQQQKAVFASKGSSSSTGSRSDRDKVLEREFGKKKTLRQISEAPVSREAKIAFWKKEEINAKSDLRDALKDLQVALQTGKSPIEMAKGSIEAQRKIKFNRAKLRFAKKQRFKAKKEASTKDYKVAMKLPTIGAVKGEWVEGKPMPKKEAQVLAKSKKKLGWKAKVVKA